MKPTLATRPREQGVALVTTIIVVAVLAVVAVAFMQSTTVDRMSSRSVANYTRAKLAAEAGLAFASATLTTNSTNDTFIVVLNANRQLFIGNGVAGGANFSYAPLFSTVTNVSSAVTPIVTGTVPSTNVPGGLFFTNLMPGGLSITSPAVSWVYLTNASGQTNARFAYWVEDLGGKLDLSVVGTNDATVARRPTGTNPAEIALWSVFNPGSVNDFANAVAGSLIGARSNVLTAATARLVNTGVSAGHLADFTASLRHDTNEPEVIPFGFGYAEQGRPKYNLNTNISAGGMSSIASAISLNLPLFGSRGGAMTSRDYINNIAASILDYADTDSNPTGDSSTYVGIENIPWPNELFDRITFSGVNTAGQITLQLRDWAEFWNMGNTNTSASMVVSISNNYDMLLTFTNSGVGTGVSFQANLNSGTFTAGALGRRDFNVPVLAPNEYRVVPANGPFPRTITFQIPNPAWFSTAPIRAAWRLLIRSNDETSNMRFRAFVGTTMIQESKGGRWPRYISSTAPLAPAPATPSSWVFNNPIGLASQPASSAAAVPPAHSGGDPRAQLFLSGPLRFGNYTNNYSSPGGRNWERARLPTSLGGLDSPGYPESEVHPGKFWPDSGHAGDADRGGNPTSATQDPDLASFAKAPLTNNFVMQRNDSGRFTNVVELGNIFDPMQWEDITATPAANQPGLWTNLTTAASGDSRFGGRNTLRVGRWEFSRFTNDGTRASQLLDIFAVGTNSSGPVTNRVSGRINLNTAGTNALRALAAGVFLASDAVALTASGVSTNSIVPASAVDDFVRAVVDTRVRRPFYSTSQLNMIGTDTAVATWPANSVFGNHTRQFITAGNDAFTEEWFARVYPLATVRSRNFLVHVIGQAVQTNNPTSVLSTARRVFQLYAEPVRGASGLTTNTVPRVLATWDL